MGAVAKIKILTAPHNLNQIENVIARHNTTVRVRCIFLKKKNRLSENPDPACQSFHTHSYYTTFCRQSKGGTPLFYNKKVIYYMY